MLRDDVHTCTVPPEAPARRRGRDRATPIPSGGLDLRARLALRPREVAPPLGLSQRTVDGLLKRLGIRAWLDRGAGVQPALRGLRCAPGRPVGELEPAARPGAARLPSDTHGDVWLVLDPTVVATLAAEQALREEPRPILFALDLARLRPKSKGAICAAIEVTREFPGGRVLQ